MTRPRFRLSARGAALAMISAAFATQASANTAGRIDFVYGEANVRAADGRLRPAAKGELVQDGDTLVTGNGRAQVRFTDGAYVSLQPNTEFGVREYRYEGKTDGSERGFFSLVRGAMRTVTGAIGRYNRSAYQVRTPTATVGIRGTGGLIAVLPDLSTLIKGTSGTWLLSNPAGQIEVPAGTSGLATPDIKAPPQQTSQSPEAPPPPPPVKEATYSEGEKTTETGEACSVTQNCSPGTSAPPPPPPMLSGPGYHVNFAYGGATASIGIGQSSSLVDATFNGTGQLTSWTDASGSTSSLLGAHAEGGNVPGVMAWGRWTGNVFHVASKDFAPNEGFHYVVGLPTPTMPTSGTASFTLVGASSPTGSDGSIASPGTLARATMTVDFGQTSVAVTLNPMFASGSWGLDTTMTGRISGQTMLGSGSATNVGATPPLAYSCSSGCSATFQGAFFGAGASNAGLAYQINAFTATVSGVAAFKQ